MKGKKITEFIDSLYCNPELEILFRKKHLMVSGYVSKDGFYTLQIATVEKNSKKLFSVTSISRQNCVHQFERAKVFDGLDIYEAESEIEVLYG